MQDHVGFDFVDCEHVVEVIETRGDLLRGLFENMNSDKVKRHANGR